VSTVTNASGCDVLVIFARCPLSYSQCPVRDNTSDQREGRGGQREKQKQKQWENTLEIGWHWH